MLGLITLARTGASLYAAKEATGILGMDDWLSAVARLAPKIAMRAHKSDRGFVDAMVERARARVPRDTGNLLNGIEARDADDDMVEFRASAVHTQWPNSREDYAHFVEHGTSRGTAGAPAVADASFFSDSRVLYGNAAASNRARKSYRNSAGTDAQPFFYNSAAEVLAERNLAMADVCPDAARELGFEVS